MYPYEPLEILWKGKKTYPGILTGRTLNLGEAVLRISVWSADGIRIQVLVVKAYSEAFLSSLVGFVLGVMGLRIEIIGGQTRFNY